MAAPSALSTFHDFLEGPGIASSVKQPRAASLDHHARQGRGPLLRTRVNRALAALQGGAKEELQLVLCPGGQELHLSRGAASQGCHTRVGGAAQDGQLHADMHVQQSRAQYIQHVTSGDRVQTPLTSSSIRIASSYAASSPSDARCQASTIATRACSSTPSLHACEASEQVRVAQTTPIMT